VLLELNLKIGRYPKCPPEGVPCVIGNRPITRNHPTGEPEKPTILKFLVHRPGTGLSSAQRHVILLENR
jgi:hypothetical protein